MRTMDTTRGPISQEDVLRETLTTAIDRIKRNKFTSNEVIATAIRLINDGVQKHGWTWEQFKTSEAELQSFKSIH